MRRAGYTLFELLLVVAILTLLATLAVPAYDAMSASMRVTESADQIRAAWAEARAHAVNEGRPYRFGYLPNRGNYRIAPDASDYWSSSGSNTASGATHDSSNTPPYILEDRLPKGVRLASTDPSAQNTPGMNSAGGDSAVPPHSVSAGSYETGTVFQPDGSADDLEIQFTARGNRPLTLRLRGLTGSVVTVKKPGQHMHK